MRSTADMRTENEGGYRVRCFAIALILQLLLYLVRYALLSLTVHLFKESEYLVIAYELIKMLLTPFVFLLPVFLYLKLTKTSFGDMLFLRGNAENYRVEREKRGNGALFFIFAAAITLNVANLAGMATDGVYSLLGIEVADTVLEPIWYVHVFTVISSVIFAPLLEELLFRGVALNALAPCGARWAVLLSGVTFALMHHSIYPLFYAFCAGCAIAFFAYAFGSVRIAIGLHLVNNLMTYLVAATECFWGETAGRWFGYLLLAVSLPVAAVGAVYFAKRGIWRSSDGQRERGETVSPFCIELVFYILFAFIFCL